ncbi:phage-related protein [Burkholderia ambifaria]|nr:phage-related protein [Burkholderia ambifaria]
MRVAGVDAARNPSQSITVNQRSAERPIMRAGPRFALIVTVGMPCAASIRNPHHPYKILYNSTILPPKPVVFVGSALDDLRGFPLPARRDAGHQIDQVQRGLAPDDWKPMRTVGVGVREIRLRDASGAFRIVYVATFADAVYVLHCFRKQSARTNKTDIDLAARRYRTLMMELKR